MSMPAAFDGGERDRHATLDRRRGARNGPRLAMMEIFFKE
jgi:hypothetical protein